MIPWVNQVDKESIVNEITAVTPTIFGTTFGEFLEPIDSYQNKLFKIMMKKQLHTCSSRWQQRTNCKNCKYGFPSKPYIEEKSMYNPETKRWEYYMPMHPCCWCGVPI